MTRKLEGMDFQQTPTSMGFRELMCLPATHPCLLHAPDSHLPDESETHVKHQWTDVYVCLKKCTALTDGSAPPPTVQPSWLTGASLPDVIATPRHWSCARSAFTLGICRTTNPGSEDLGNVSFGESQPNITEILFGAASTP